MAFANLNVRDLYFYLVCFMSIIIFTMGMVQGVGNLLDLFYPDPNVPWVMDRFQREVKEGLITEEEAEQRIEEMQALEKQRQKIRDIKELAQNIVMIGIAIPLFVIHWKHASKNA